MENFPSYHPCAQGTCTVGLKRVTVPISRERNMYAYYSYRKALTAWQLLIYRTYSIYDCRIMKRGKKYTCILVPFAQKLIR